MTTKKHEATKQLLANLLSDYEKPENLIGENELLKQLTKLPVEKALDVELSEHLGHDRHETVANDSGNTRKGKSKKYPQAGIRQIALQSVARQTSWDIRCQRGIKFNNVYTIRGRFIDCALTQQK